VTLRSCEMEFR